MKARASSGKVDFPKIYLKKITLFCTNNIAE